MTSFGFIKHEHDLYLENLSETVDFPFIDRKSQDLPKV